jgi:Major Facilitator Superfamily
LLIRAVDEFTGFLAPAHLERFHADLGVSYGALGLVMAMPYLGGLAADALLIRSDGTDRKHVCIAGALTTAVSLLVVAVAGGVWPLAAGGLIWGMGATALVEGGEIALSNGAEGPLERTLARVNLGAVLGDLSAPLVVAAARLAGVDWRWLFVAAAALTGGYAVVLARRRFPPPRPAPASAALDEQLDADSGRDLAGAEVPGAGGAEPVPILRHAAVWWIGVAAFVTGPLDEPLLATVLAYVQQQRGVSGTVVQLLAAGFVAGGVAVFTVLLSHVEARQAPAMLVGAGAMMAVAGFGILLVPVWAIALVGFAHSAALDAQWLTMQAAALRVAPGREGRAGALIDVIEIVSLVVPITFGLVAERAGLGASVACYAVWPLLLVVPAAGLHRCRPGAHDRRAAARAS